MIFKVLLVFKTQLVWVLQGGFCVCHTYYYKILIWTYK